MTQLVSDDRQTLGSVFIYLNPVNTPLLIEMERRLFYTVCLTPGWSSRIFGSTCSGILNLSSRLSGTMRFNRMK